MGDFNVPSVVRVGIDAIVGSNIQLYEPGIILSLHLSRSLGVKYIPEYQAVPVTVWTVTVQLDITLWRVRRKAMSLGSVTTTAVQYCIQVQYIPTW